MKKYLLAFLLVWCCVVPALAAAARPPSEILAVAWGDSQAVCRERLKAYGMRKAVLEDVWAWRGEALPFAQEVLHCEARLFGEDVSLHLSFFDDRLYAVRIDGIAREHAGEVRRSLEAAYGRTTMRSGGGAVAMLYWRAGATDVTFTRVDGRPDLELLLEDGEGAEAVRRAVRPLVEGAGVSGDER